MVPVNPYVATLSLARPKSIAQELVEPEWPDVWIDARPRCDSVRCVKISSLTQDLSVAVVTVTLKLQSDA